MSDFTHLHLHTEYSLLDGANKLDELANTLKAQGVKSVGISDHGNMFGAIDFYKTMKAHDIKPIIGIEAYIHNGSSLADKEKLRFHLCLFAKNEIGYKNLMYLSSQSYISGYYYNARINKELLAKNHEGLICTSACLQGEINWQLNLSGKNKERGAKGYEEAKKIALWYKELFKDDFYLELMRHGIKEQRNIDDDIIKLSKELNIKIIASNDTHYTFKDRAKAHEVFMCIAMAKKLNDANRLKHSVHEFYLKTKEQMSELFADIPEAISNTQEIVDKCNLELKLGDPKPPNFKFSKELAKKEGVILKEESEISTINDNIIFEHMCRKGLKERLGFVDESKHQEYKERLEREIKIIQKMTFSGYMLIVYDFIAYAKSVNIPIGPGRGSAAGSLVAFALGITNIDPMPYKLLFERFLNEERVSMPDIDIDFCQERRDEVIEYVSEKYGNTQVAQVATFGKLLARGVIRDVARVCDMSLKDADTLAKLIPDELKITLKAAYEKEAKIKAFINEHEKGEEVWEYAKALEGLIRNSGVHAAGIVISNEPLWEKTPLFKPNKQDSKLYATQYSKDLLEDVDLIKFDFLGLKTLTVIENTLKAIKKKYNKDIIWEQINTDDKKIYELIQSGHTLGLFQIESSGMQSLNSRLKPECFEDLIAVLALFRPGPLDSGMVEDFIQVKHGKKEASYAFAELKPILENTYGVIVYQEQVMQVVQTIGGFSLAEADNVRRAMGKKKKSILDKLKNSFLEGASKKGFDAKKAGSLFDLILKFAEYGFNKSHSAAYAMISFQTAYLKAYYPGEFMAALLSSETKNMDNIIKYINEIKRLGFSLLAPNINYSFKEFSALQKDGKNMIYFGLGAIKGLGNSVIEEIIRERPKDGFKDMDDLLQRLSKSHITKRGLQVLSKIGALGDFGYSRKSLYLNAENISKHLRDLREIKQEASFGLFEEEEISSGIKFNINDCEDFTQKEKLGFEKEFLGIYVSGHPLDEYEDILKEIKHSSSLDFEDLEDKGELLVLAKLEELKNLTSKRGKNYQILTLTDRYTSFNITCFEENMAFSEEIAGYHLRYEKKEEELSLLLNKVYSIADLRASNIKPIKRYKKQSAPIKEIPYKRLAFELASLDIESILKIESLVKEKKLDIAQQNSARLILEVRTEDECLEFKSPFVLELACFDEIENIILRK